MYYACGMAKNAQYGKKKIIQLSIILTILIIGGVAAYWYFAIYAPKQAAHTSSVAAVTYVEMPITDVPLKAAEYAKQAGFDGGLAYYDVQIAHHADPADQRRLLVYKANFATQAKKYDLALQTLQRAAKISPDASVTIALAQTYEAKEDKQAAIDQYQKLLDATSKDGMGARYNGQWQAKIAELKR